MAKAVDSAGSGYDPLTSSCEYGNERLSDSIEGLGSVRSDFFPVLVVGY
jgi:hypothetical protein